VAVYHVLAYWGAMFSPSVQAVFDIFKRLPAALLLLLLPLLGAVLLLWPVRRADLSGRVLYATGSTGFAGMYAELFLLLTLQVFYGYIYLQLSLLLALFMAGTAAGGTLSHKWLEMGAGPLALLRKTETAILFALLVLPLISFLPIYLLGSAWTLMIFLVLSFLAGSLVGLTFPLAVRLQPAGRKAAGAVYAADLMGGWLGGLCAVMFLVPLLGLRETAVAVMLVKAGSWLALWRAKHFGDEQRNAVS